MARRLLAVLVQAALLALVPEASPQAVIDDLGVALQENFDTLANAGTSSSVPTGWAYLETPAADGLYTAGTGSSTTADVYSFGSAASSDRAFGGLQTGSLVPTIGANFLNSTASTINEVEIKYTGEKWRQGFAGRVDRIDFQYSTNATGIGDNAATWNDVDSLDFSTPDPNAATGSKDGNLALNQTMISFTIVGLGIADGSSFWIRWTDFNASNADDGLAIDDFKLTATMLGTATGTPTVTATASSTVTSGPSSTPTNTGTATATRTATNTGVASATPTGTRTSTATRTLTSSPTVTSTLGPPPNVIINEIDADQPGTDSMQFIELFSAAGATSLNGTTLVLINGSNDSSYEVFDLDGRSTDASGYFVVGDPNVPGVDLVFTGPTTMENGTDAVALYNGDFADNTPATSLNLIDAIVYETGDTDDPNLVEILIPGQPEVSEGADNNTSSIQRCPNGSGGALNTMNYVIGVPNPGADNPCPATTATPTVTPTRTGTATRTSTATATASATGQITQTPVPAGSVVINEVVTDPQRDWNDPNSPDGIPFNATPGPDAPADDDEWLELVNVSGTTLDLTGWTLEMNDGVNAVTITLGSGAIYVFSAGSLSSFPDGARLVVGDPTGVMNNDIFVVLNDSAGNLVDDVEIGDDLELDGAGDGAPDPGADGNASSAADEAIARGPDLADTDNDVNDFCKQSATIGFPNSSCPTPTPGPSATPTKSATVTPTGPTATVTLTRTPTLTRTATPTGPSPTPSNTPPPATGMLINEVDADVPTGTDTEFVELYDGGTGNKPLHGLVVVLYNGSNDLSYGSFDLDGHSTDGNGYFVLGDPNVPGVDLAWGSTSLQDGADAVAVYVGNAVDYPADTPVDTANLLDAFVYGTGDPDDPNLMVLLNPGQPQVDESGAGDSDRDSSQRCPNGSGGQRNTLGYDQFPPSAGSANLCVPPPTATVTATRTPGPSATRTATLPPPIPGGDVVINEFQTGGFGTGTTTQEFVELRSNRSSSVSLQGYAVVYRDGGGEEDLVYAFPNGTTLAAGQRFLLHSAAFPTPAANCGSQVALFDPSGVSSLSSTEGGLALVRLADGVPVDSVEYWDGSGSAPFSGLREGDGPSLAPSGGRSASRFPDGTDSNQNNCDFVIVASSPGCPNVSTTPTPAPSNTPTPTATGPTATRTHTRTPTNTRTPNLNTPTPTPSPAHTPTPPFPATSMKINEIAYTRTGKTNFIELRLAGGPAGASLDNFWLLRIEGDPAGTGRIDRALDLSGFHMIASASSGSDDGYFTIGEDKAAYESAYQRCAETYSTFVNLESGPDALVLVYAPNTTSTSASLADVGGVIFDKVAYASEAGSAPLAGLAEGSAASPGLSASDGSLARRSNADTNNNDADFLITCPEGTTPGESNGATDGCPSPTPTPTITPTRTPAPAGLVVINEVVTDPQQDWNDDPGTGDGIPFSPDPGTGAPSAASDEWIELFNKSSATVNLNDWTLAMDDGSIATEVLGTDSAELYFSDGGSLASFGPGEYLVIGNPEGTMNLTGLTVSLTDPRGVLVDRVVVADGNASGTANEAFARFPNGRDTGVDTADFRKQAATIAANNGLLTLAAVSLIGVGLLVLLVLFSGTLVPRRTR